MPAHHGLRDDPTQLCYGPRRAPDAADVDGAALVAACAAAWVACRFSILSTSSAGAPAQRRGLRRSYIPTRARKQAPPSTSHRLSQLLEGDKQPEQSVGGGPVHYLQLRRVPELRQQVLGGGDGGVGVGGGVTLV